MEKENYKSLKNQLQREKCSKTEAIDILKKYNINQNKIK